MVANAFSSILRHFTFASVLRDYDRFFIYNPFFESPILFKKILVSYFFFVTLTPLFPPRSHLGSSQGVEGVEKEGVSEAAAIPLRNCSQQFVAPSFFFFFFPSSLFLSALDEFGAVLLLLLLLPNQLSSSMTKLVRTLSKLKQASI